MRQRHICACRACVAEGGARQYSAGIIFDCKDSDVRFSIYDIEKISPDDDLACVMLMQHVGSRDARAEDASICVKLEMAHRTWRKR